MAIQPRFAQAILGGGKLVEFRKRRLAEDIDIVLIYESAPTQRVVGRFTVDRTVEATPSALWRELGEVGGIPRAEFFGYYAGHKRAVGLIVTAVERFHRPVSLDELSASPAVPQSFAYLPATTLDEIDALQPVRPFVSLAGLVGRVVDAPGRLLASTASH